MTILNELDNIINSVNFLTETASQSLSRILNHTYSKNGFSLVTPFRKEVSTKENFDNLHKAEKIAKDYGFGFFKVRGFWYETKDNDKSLIEEISLFIPNYKGHDLLDVSKKISNLSILKQDGFIFADGSGKIEYWAKDGEDYRVAATMNKITFDSVKNLLEKLKKKEIVGASARDREKNNNSNMTSGYYFENFWVKPGNSIGAVIFNSDGYIF
jgi:hypothetical protein